MQVSNGLLITLTQKVNEKAACCRNVTQTC